MALITLDTAIKYINQNNKTDVDEDQQWVIEDLIKKVSKMFNSYLGRDLESTTHIETYDGNGLPRLRLYNWPITTITNLYEDTSRQFESSSILDTDTYAIYNEKYIQLLSTVFYNTYGSIKVEYIAGYTKKNMPEDIKLACITEVVRNYKNRYMSGDFGITAITTPQGTNYNFSALPLLEDTQMILDSYMY